MCIFPTRHIPMCAVTEPNIVQRRVRRNIEYTDRRIETRMPLFAFSTVLIALLRNKKKRKKDGERKERKQITMRENEGGEEL